jgi:WD40 repeat protein
MLQQLWNAIKETLLDATISSTRLNQTPTIKSVDFNQIIRGAVKDMAFSPNGKTLIANTGMNVWIYDVQTGNTIHVLKHSRRVWKVAYSPSGSLIATGSEDHSIYLWDAHTGKQIRTLKGHRNTIEAIKFSHDGKWLASGSWDKTARIWDVETGNPIKTIDAHKDHVHDIAFSPDDTRFVTGGGNRELIIWDTHTWEKSLALPQPTMPPKHIVFSAQGDRIVCEDFNNIIWIWDAQTGERLNQKEHGYLDTRSQVVFCPEGYNFKTKRYKTMRVWDVHTNDTIYLFHEFPLGVGNATFSLDRRLLASNRHYTLEIMELQTSEIVQAISGHTTMVTIRDYSPNQQHCAAGCGDWNVRVWDSQTGDLLQTLAIKGVKASVRKVKYSPDGKHIAAVTYDEDTFFWPGEDGVVHLWDAETGAYLHRLEGHKGDIEKIAFSRDSKQITSTGEDKTIRTWDIQTGKQLRGSSS